MPKKLVVSDHLSEADLKQRYLSCEEAQEARRWHAVWLVKGGRTAREVAQLLGVSDWSVCAWVAKFNAQGAAGLADGRAGNHGQRLLSDAQEAELARRLETEHAPDGGLWSGPKVALLLGEWLGRPVNDQQAWRIMVRLGFRPKHPRPRHPEADLAAQEAFKKGALAPA